MLNTYTIDTKEPKKKRRPKKDNNKTVVKYKPEFVDLVKSIYQDGYADHLEDFYENYQNNQRYTPEFLSFSSTHLKEAFGSKMTEKYTPEFLLYLTQLFGNKGYEYVENKNEPQIINKYPQSSRYTAEYVKEREKSCSNVKKFRANAKAKNINAIKQIREDLSKIIELNGIFPSLSNSKICLSCYEIKDLNNNSECCLKDYNLASALNLIVSFLRGFDVCNCCGEPHKGVTNHLIKCPLNPNKSKELYYNVLPGDNNKFYNELSKIHIESNSIDMDFKFVQNVLTKIVEKYTNNNLNNESYFATHIDSNYISEEKNAFEINESFKPESNEKISSLWFNNLTEVEKKNLVSYDLLNATLEEPSVKRPLMRVYSDEFHEIHEFEPSFETALNRNEHVPSFEFYTENMEKNNNDNSSNNEAFLQNDNLEELKCLYDTIPFELMDTGDISFHKNNVQFDGISINIKNAFDFLN